MRVVIDGKLEIDLPAIPRQGEILAWYGDARRVAEVTWVIPPSNKKGQAPTAEDVSVHIQLEQDQ